MNSLLISLKDRLKNFLSFYSDITQPYIANTDPAMLYLNNADNFNVGFAMRNMVQASIYYTDGAIQRRIKVKIKSVDMNTNTIILNEPITVNIPVGAKIKRTPNWEEVNNFYLGDPTTISASNLPAICVVPQSKDIEWYTLTGTKEKEVFNILIHTLADNQDNSEITMTRITEDVVELLNADLHLKINGRDINGYNRPFNSLVTNVSYTYSNKGSFCRTAQISWFSEEYWQRFYVTNQEADSNFDPFP